MPTLSYVACFSQATCLAFFSCPAAFVSAVTYSTLWQLGDARWPNSARSSQGSLGRQRVGETAPQYCICSSANVHSPTRRASVSILQRLHNFIFCLFRYCFTTKRTIFSGFFSALHPFPDFLFHCVNKYKESRKEPKTHMHTLKLLNHSDSFLLPLFHLSTFVVNMIEMLSSLCYIHFFTVPLMILFRMQLSRQSLSTVWLLEALINIASYKFNLRYGWKVILNQASHQSYRILW